MDINARFGRLIFVAEKGVIKRKRRGLFHCDCGNVTEAVISSVKIGRTRSCGCLQLESLVNAHKAQRGVYGASCCRAIFNMYRCSARKRKLSFQIAYEDFKKLTKHDCVYCGSPPANIKRNKNYYGEYSYTGIDRVNNTKGYTTSNVVPCCKMCNYMKLDYSQGEFLAHVEKITKHLDKAKK